MRIVIDMQGAQTESRYRGIGRYTMSFAKAVVRNRADHEVFLALNGLFPETVEPIRAAFEDLLSQDNIRVWQALGPVCERLPGNDARRQGAEILREAFLASLLPDVVHITSLFEGFIDDAVTSVGSYENETPISVTLYDLIPLQNPEHFLKPNPAYEKFYRRKLHQLTKANLFLAISQFTASDALEQLALSEHAVIPVMTALQEGFEKREIDKAEKAKLFEALGITKPFILYTGGCDDHKNLPRLITAFDQLPAEIKTRHQLVFAGRMPEVHIVQLKEHARKAGLARQDLVFTGYISDEQLVMLYNLCDLFVYPSWQEGFGLPPLEAMACGAPVIASGATSLAEVVGWDEATFNPTDVGEISAKMLRALTDSTFRQALSAHGLEQSRSFSWDATARKSWEAWEFLGRQKVVRESAKRKTSLAAAIQPLVSSFDDRTLARLSADIAANELAGLERQLFVDVSEFCQWDAGTGVQRVVRNHLKNLLASPPAGFRVNPVFATREQGYRYARDFARSFMGSSAASGPDEPIQWQRGDIFFALDMQHHVQLQHREFFRLLRAEGVTVKFMVYDLLPIQLRDLFSDSNARELHAEWLRMIALTDAAICISQATADAFSSWILTEEVDASPNLSLDAVHLGADLSHANPSNGRPKDADEVLLKLRKGLTFLCVSTVEPRKRQQQIIGAFEILWAAGHDVNLVFVGREGWKVGDFARKLREHPEGGRRFFWLEGISDEYLDQVYSAADCTIAASLDEGFGLSLIESAIKGVGLIARDIPVFREVAGGSAYYFTGDTAKDLATAVEDWIKLNNTGSAPRAENLGYLTWKESTEELKAKLIKSNYPRHQLLVDVSELVQKDAGSGIQRVVKNVLNEWLSHPPSDYRVEPVYASPTHGYRYARQFTANFMRTSANGISDSPIDYAPGDIFFGLDFQPQVAMAQREFYQILRHCGVRVEFLVHDLLSIQMPEYFLPGNKEGFEQWLRVVCESDGAVCVSKSVSEDLAKWFISEPANTQKRRQFRIQWNHNGVGIGPVMRSSHNATVPSEIIAKISARPAFLSVGTIEPRKGIKQALEAFEILWTSDADVSFVLVGKKGWMVDELIDQITSHPELDRRLFWLQGISDQNLEEVYNSCCCLLAPSFGEGFGLPLIEAAQRALPILARDLPVFREVAGCHAVYFKGNAPEELAKAVKEWLEKRKSTCIASSRSMPYLTWSKASRNLLEKVTSLKH